jgi:hypothetical protein
MPLATTSLIAILGLPMGMKASTTGLYYKLDLFYWFFRCHTIVFTTDIGGDIIAALLLPRLFVGVERKETSKIPEI